MSGLGGLFIAKLVGERDLSDDDLYHRLTLVAALGVLIPVHCFFLVFYLLAGTPLFVCINIGSLLLLVFGIMPLCKREKLYNTAGILIALEGVVYNTLVCALFGISSYHIGYFLLTLLLQNIFSLGTPRNRFGLSVLIACIVTALLALLYGKAPALVIDGLLNDVITIFNIGVIFAGTFLELYLAHLINKIVANTKSARLAELSSQVYTDPLTGLYNRRYAPLHFGLLRKRPGGNTDLCAAMLDIDDFKLINDTYGHAVGDEALVFLADFLRRSLRKTDCIFRWGGEEFLLLLDHISIPQAYKVLDALRDRFANAEIVTKQNTTLHITVTIGVAPFLVDNPENGIEQSDQNLYKGKRSGKNRVVADL